MSSFQPHQSAGSSNGAYAGTGRSADGRNRVLQGVPTAGQFAAERHSDAVISLNLDRAPQPPAYIRIPQQVFAAVRSLVGSTVRKVRGRSMQDRPHGRPRAFSTRARVAVTALVLAASAASLTACGTTNDTNCKPAASGTSVVQTTAATASFITQVPAKGGGGGGGHGSSGGHSSSSGHSSSGGHASEGGSTSGHANEGGTSGGTSNGSTGGLHFWPFGSHSSNQQCPAPTPTSKT